MERKTEDIKQTIGEESKQRKESTANEEAVVGAMTKRLTA